MIKPPVIGHVWVVLFGIDMYSLGARCGFWQSDVGPAQKQERAKTTRLRLQNWQKRRSESV
jgi:hypothetical protein